MDLEAEKMTPLLFYKLRWAAMTGDERFIELETEWAKKMNNQYKRHKVEEFRKYLVGQDLFNLNTLKENLNSLYVPGWVAMVRKYFDEDEYYDPTIIL
jgi:hypothetical protein